MLSAASLLSSTTSRRGRRGGCEPRVDSATKRMESFLSTLSGESRRTRRHGRPSLYACLFLRCRLTAYGIPPPSDGDLAAAKGIARAAEHPLGAEFHDDLPLLVHGNDSAGPSESSEDHV